ncbi:hypothetical protein [Ketobacter sp.]
MENMLKKSKYVSALCAGTAMLALMTAPYAQAGKHTLNSDAPSVKVLHRTLSGGYEITYAVGKMHDARFSANGEEYIRCGISHRSDYPFEDETWSEVGCKARTAAGVELSCGNIYASDDMVRIVTAINESSWVRFEVLDGSSECGMIWVNNSSQNL